MSVYRFRKEELEQHLNKGAMWAVVYGDLMSYLMILFMLMLSFTLARTRGVKKRSAVEESLIEIQRVFGGEVDPNVAARSKRKDKELMVGQNLAAAAAAGKLGKETSVIVTEKRITLNLGEGILFRSGQAKLKPAAREVLASIVRDMASVKNEIRVEGHTDNIPMGKRSRYNSNWELSMARAYSVISTLENLGVNSTRISGVGYGEFRPVADNKTRRGRAANRRIEISLLRED
jgi:chemotaxis protein MotB